MGVRAGVQAGLGVLLAAAAVALAARPSAPLSALAGVRAAPPMPAALAVAASGSLPGADPAVLAAGRQLLGDTIAALRTGRIAAALAQLDGDFAAARAFVARAARRGDTVELEPGWSELDASLGGAALTTLTLRARAPWGSETARLRVGVVHVIEVDGAWRLREAWPWEAVAASHVDAVAAEVWIDPGREWVAVDAHFDVARPPAAAAEPIVISIAGIAPAALPTADSDEARARLRLVAVDLDGAPAAFQLAADAILVAPRHPSPHLAVHLRYEGEVHAGSDYAVRDPYTTAADRMHLLHLLPLIEGSAPHYTVTGWSPSTVSLLGPCDPLSSEQPRTPHPASRIPFPNPVPAPGWHSTLWHCGPDIAFLLFAGRPRPAPRTTTLPGGLHLDLDGELSGVEPQLAAAAAALAPLGPWPVGSARLVDYARPRGQPEGELAGQTILVDWTAAREDPDEARQLLTHELAHLWFGGRVLQGGRSAMRWWEAVAAYVSLWVLPPDRAATVRADWRERSRGLPGIADRPLAPALAVSGDDADVLSYMKGPLVLWALERRIGRPAVAAALRQLVQSRSGATATWDDVIDAVAITAGDDQARWLRGELGRAGLPAEASP